MFSVCNFKPGFLQLFSFRCFRRLRFIQKICGKTSAETKPEALFKIKNFYANLTQFDYGSYSPHAILSYALCCLLRGEVYSLSGASESSLKPAGPWSNR